MIVNTNVVLQFGMMATAFVNIHRRIIAIRQQSTLRRRAAELVFDGIVLVLCNGNRTLFFAGRCRVNRTLVYGGESALLVPWVCEGGGVSML